MYLSLYINVLFAIINKGDIMSEKEMNTKGKVNYRKLNQVLQVSHNVLRIMYILSIVACIFTFIIIIKELSIFKYFLEVLSILSPLFIGLFVAWLFNPVVNFLGKKGVKRIFSVLLIYIIILGVLGLLVGSIMPILYEQIIGFAKSLPSLFESIEDLLDTLLDKLQNVDGINVSDIKNNIMSQLENKSTELTSGITTYAVNLAKGLISGISTFVVGLIIGFFCLLSFENVGDTLIGFVPKKFRADTKKLSTSINGSLRNYVVGLAIDATVVFAICSIAFSLIGLKAPLLFAVFCAITNVIPYVGPYIGAIPALIVGFAMSPTIGLLTLGAIVIIQFFEGNFLQEYIMSKTTKLHPVTIITGLLVFGHYWGVLGMVVSTPFLAIVKQVYLFLDEKYDFFKNNDENDEVIEDNKEGKKDSKSENEKGNEITKESKKEENIVEIEKKDEENKEIDKNNEQNEKEVK